MVADVRAYEEMSRIGRALGAPARLALLDLLAQRPCSVEQLAAMSGTSVASTSQHLKVLRAAKLVRSTRDGRRVICSLAPGADPFLLSMRELAVALLPELGAIRRSLEIPGDDPRALLARFTRGEVDAIDVRPADEFAAGHLDGARSIPVSELRARLSELSKARALIAYCRGPWCAFAGEAVELLREHGFTAHRLELGVSDFRALGLAR